jgi:hypothetical protein
MMPVTVVNDEAATPPDNAPTVAADPTAKLTSWSLPDLSLPDNISTVGRSSSSEPEDDSLPRRRRRVRRSVQRERRALREQEQAALLACTTMAQATVEPNLQFSFLQPPPSPSTASNVGSSLSSEDVAAVVPEDGYIPRVRRRVRRSVQRERRALREAASLLASTPVAPAIVQSDPQSSTRPARQSHSESSPVASSSMEQQIAWRLPGRDRGAGRRPISRQ